jgi:hypothetical protein
MRIGYPIVLLFTLLALLLSTTHALSPPTLSLANSIASNQIDLVMGSASDSALITATCSIGDTCQIWEQGGTSALATGTTTATLAYSALPGSATTGIYANDITGSLTSNGLYNSIIRRIVAANSITITLTNNQGIAVSANTPLMVSFNALNFSGIYPVKISSTLNNTYLAFSNGTVTYSWLEGNLSDEQGDTNSLINADQVIYWFRGAPSGSFLPANTGTATTNTIELEMDIPANSVWDGNFIGAAPQLSCQNPASTSSCIGTAGATGYAYWDNGKSIFELYDNFNGANLSSIWTTNVLGGGAASVNNGLTMSVSSSTDHIFLISNAEYALPLDIETYYLQPPGANHAIGISTTNSIGSGANGAPYNGYGTDGGPNWRINLYSQSSAASIGVPATFTQVVPNMTTFSWIATGDLALYQNYVQKQTTTDATFSMPSEGYLYYGISSGAVTSPVNLQYIRARIMPPNNIMPSESFSPVNSRGYVSPTMPILTLLNASKAVVDQGQSFFFKAVLSSGAAPYSYSYNVYAYNTLTSSNVLIANMLFAGNSLTSNSWLWTPSGDLSVGNSIFEANVSVTDSHQAMVNSTRYSFGYNSALVAGIMPVSPSIDLGQSITLTANPTGGTKPYTSILWFSGNNCAGTPISSGNSLVVSPTATVTYSYRVYDSATVQVNSCSGGDTITVNQLPTISITPLSSTIDAGYGVTFTNITTPGTPPYSYSYNVIGNNVISNDFTIGGNNLITFNSAGNYVVTENVIDSAGGNSVSNNALVSVNPILTVSILVASPTIVTGNSTMLNANAINGSSPYTYQWYNGILCDNANTITGANTALYSTPTLTSTTSYCVVATDSLDANAISTAMVTVTTPPPPSGGGGGGGGGGSGGPGGSGGGGGGGSSSAGGGGGGGGSSLPSLIPYINGTVAGWLITNLTVGNSETFPLSNKTTHLTVNFITPTTAGITVNNQTYTLTVNNTVSLTNTSNSTDFVVLKNLSYLPILHSIALLLYETNAQPVFTPVSNATNSPTANINATTQIPPPTSSIIAGNATVTTTIAAVVLSTASAKPNYTYLIILIAAAAIILVIAASVVAARRRRRKYL